MILRGVVITGLGQATALTQLPWVVTQIEAKLGIRPYPGTLNLEVVDEGDASRWKQLKRQPGIALEEPLSSNCAAVCFPARLEEEVAAAILLPGVPGYPANQIEIIAGVNVRQTLGLRDGDAVTVRVLERDHERS
jgi:CTP-dependent riboflavin kinase